MKIHELFAYLRVEDTPRAIEFYKAAFGATELFRLVEPSGRVGHAELDFGGVATVMVCDEFPEYGLRSPHAYGGTAVTIHLHVDDADAALARAVAAGGTLVRATSDAFDGLDLERLRALRARYGVTHAVLPTYVAAGLPLPVLYQDAAFRVFGLTELR